jgi:hypothetical protein
MSIMVEIGKLNTLKVNRHSEFGVYLDGKNLGEILLPNRFVPDACEDGDQLEVFLCYDSEDRLNATTERPWAMVGEYAILPVVAVERVGAFLDWGLSKDLFLPFAEQSRDLRVGQDVIVYVYLDKSQRISASMRIERNASKTAPDYQEMQPVELFVFGRTDLGYKAIIEGKHIGVLYENEVFHALEYGQKIQGFIKKVREDGKIDLTLQQGTGHKAADPIAEKILQRLQDEGGYLEVNDKTSAEVIHEMFGASKKKYKIALGGLYKKRLITIDPDGIRLIKK